MSRARIITRSPEASGQLAEQLRARGFEVETSSVRDNSAPPADLEMQLEECDVAAALQRAALEAGPYGCVFICPGAIAEDFRPMAVIPLIPDGVAEVPARERLASESVRGELVCASAVSPAEIAPKAVSVACIAESFITEGPIAKTSDPTLALPQRFEEPASAQPLAHPEASSTSDLAPHLQASDSGSEANLQPDTTIMEKVPVLVEARTVVAGEADNSAEVHSASPEIHPHEVPVSEVQVEIQAPEVRLPDVGAQAPRPDEQLVCAQEIAEKATKPDLTQSESVRSEPMRLAELPGAPGTLLAQVEEVAPVVCEQRRTEPTVTVQPQAHQPINLALAGRFRARKITISFPRLQRRAYYLGAAALAAVIAVEAWVLIFAAPALHVGKVQNSGQTVTHPQIQTAATTAAKATPARRTASEHRSVRAADEGYVAKNTVVHYASRANASPAAKSKVERRSVQN